MGLGVGWSQAYPGPAYLLKRAMQRAGPLPDSWSKLRLPVMHPPLTPPLLTPAHLPRSPKAVCRMM